MNSPLTAVGFAALVALGSVVLSPTTATSPPRATVQVTAHCPNGGTEAFVTPGRVRVAVGDNLVWRTTGQTVADSIEISLKDGNTPWPFAGTMPVGQSAAGTGAASTRGTFQYAVRLVCRIPGGGTRVVVIDPDIIIE